MSPANAEIGDLLLRAEMVLVSVEGERDAWVSLLQRLAALGQRATEAQSQMENCLATAESAITGLPNAVALATTAIGAVPGLEPVLAHANQSLADVQASVKGLAEAVSRGGVLTEGLDQMEEAVIEIDEVTDTEIERVSDAAATLIADLSDTWPELLTTAVENLDDARQELAEALEETMDEGLQESCHEATAAVDSVVGSVGDATDDIVQIFTTEAQAIIGESRQRLGRHRGQWAERTAALGTAYGDLVRDLDGLGRDLSDLYSLVTTGMQTSGIGMHAAASSLDDLKNLMGGVA